MTSTPKSWNNLSKEVQDSFSREFEQKGVSQIAKEHITQAFGNGSSLLDIPARKNRSTKRKFSCKEKLYNWWADLTSTGEDSPTS